MWNTPTTEQPKLKTIAEKVQALLEMIEKREAERILQLQKSLEQIKNHKPFVDMRK